MNFATLQGLTIPEGNVVEITDASGRALWELQNSKEAVLQVSKQTLDTYAGETAYTGESFIAIDVYPKTNGTVSVTYGGLTKTIRDTSGAEEPNAQTVYFGTLYGVSDSVATPDSGELVIEGDFAAFGCGTYTEKGKLTGLASAAYCGCITAVNEWGRVTSIPNRAFYNCEYLTIKPIPFSVTSIGTYAFYGCDGITSIVVPYGVTHLADSTFEECRNLTSLTLPSTLETIGSGVAFSSLNYTIVLTINVLATTPPTWVGTGDSMGLLINGNSCHNIITVPKGCLEAYQTANGWSEYATYDAWGNTVTMKEVS